VGIAEENRRSFVIQEPLRGRGYDLNVPDDAVSGIGEPDGGRIGSRRQKHTVRARSFNRDVRVYVEDGGVQIHTAGNEDNTTVSAVCRVHSSLESLLVIGPAVADRTELRYVKDCAGGCNACAGH
jgi:hypothetical protein